MARESRLTREKIFHYTKELLLQHGYGGFHFGMLAEKLNVTREALYKHFQNKDHLITQFMVKEMDDFINDIKKIKDYPAFASQLDYLLRVILNYKKIHQILNVTFNIQDKSNDNVKKNLEKLNKYHLHMYNELNEFIQRGKEENILKSSIPNHILLGFIFQTVSIPNHQNISETDWHNAIKELICHGIFQ